MSKINFLILLMLMIICGSKCHLDKVSKLLSDEIKNEIENENDLNDSTDLVDVSSSVTSFSSTSDNTISHEILSRTDHYYSPESEAEEDKKSLDDNIVDSSTVNKDFSDDTTTSLSGIEDTTNTFETTETTESTQETTFIEPDPAINFETEETTSGATSTFAMNRILLEESSNNITLGCEIVSSSESVKNDSSVEITWNVNNPTLCLSRNVTFMLINKNCETKCNQTNGGILSQEFLLCKILQCTENSTNNASLGRCTFYNLQPCALYYYVFVLTNSNQTVSERSDEFAGYPKYESVTNLMVVDEPDPSIESRLNLIVSWNYKYQACNQQFLIYVKQQNGDSILERFNLTTEYSKVFPNIPACTNLSISVELIDFEDYKVFVNHSTNRVSPSAIRNLNLTQRDNETAIRMSWDHPEYGRYCIKRYDVIVSNDFESPDNKNLSNEQNTEVILNVMACVNYTIVLTTFSEDIQQESTTTIPPIGITPTVSVAPHQHPSSEYVEARSSSSLFTDPRPFIRPRQLTLIDSTDSTLTLYTSVEDERNKCKVVEYEFQCEPTSGGQLRKEQSPKNQTTIDRLNAYQNYLCKVRVKNEYSQWSEFSENTQHLTKQGIPNAPKVSILNETITSSSFTVIWAEPTEPKGILKNYRIFITFSNFLYENPPYCSSDSTDSITVNLPAEDERTYPFKQGLPFSEYSVQVQAINRDNEGSYSMAKYIDTKEEPANRVENFTIIPNNIDLDTPFNRTTLIKWSFPCQANGLIKGFDLNFTSNRFAAIQRNVEHTKGQYDYVYVMDHLHPNVQYTISIHAYSDLFLGRTHHQGFNMKAGILEFSFGNTFRSRIDVDISTKSIKLSVPTEIFHSEVGEIIDIAILLAELDCGNVDPTPKRDFIENEGKLLKWIVAKQNKCIPLYQTTKIDAKHESDGTMFSISIGSALCDEELEEQYCNGPLKPGTRYAIILRLYTETGYTDTDFIPIVTDKEVAIVAILISVLTILCVAFLIGFYISYRKTIALRKSAVENPYERKDITVQSFAAYYKEMMNNDSEKIKAEFNAINFFADNLDKTSIASKANENLNRYLNISPYDSNRVVLNEDEFENDYINASFINGYYHLKEYIATQGPKPHTAFDFWRMVLQYKVESIVMLTSLVENNQIKCHEYFPKINGHLTLDNIKIVCVAEEKHAVYIKRILEVEKDDVKLRVNHYYFLKWPDHGCPSNSSDLIDFIKVVRNERQKQGGTFIVHCSAGVGRTGTYIALDIILQRIKQDRKINIFDLVKQLRFQRMKMVQSSNQYIFLYTATFEWTSKTKQPKALQNIGLHIDNFELLKKWKNWTEKNDNIIKADEKESSL